jgi:hypothetical protein
MLARLATLVIVLAAASGAAFLIAVQLRYGEAALGFWRAILFYGVPALSILLLLVALCASAAARKAVAASLIGVVAGIYGIEIYITGPSASQMDARRAYAEAIGAPYDPRTRAQIVGDLRAEGANVMPVFYPRGMLWRPAAADGSTLYPLAPHANRRIVHCREEGPWLLYNTDEHGFNNPPGLWDGRRIELVLVGDSFAWGVCVPREASIAGWLHARVPATVTVGMSANGPLLMLATLREYLPHVHPSTVLWFFYENDLTDLENERANALLAAYLDPAFEQGLFDRRAEIESFLDAYMVERLAGEAGPAAGPGAWEMILRTLTLTKLRVILAGLLGRVEFDWPLHERILGLARDEVRGWGGVIYLVYLPTPQQLLGVPDLTNYRRAIKARLLAMAEHLGVPVIDTEPALTAVANRRTLVPYIGAHYGAEGYEIVARTIFKALVADGRVPAGVPATP